MDLWLLWQSLRVLDVELLVGAIIVTALVLAHIFWVAALNEVALVKFKLFYLVFVVWALVGGRDVDIGIFLVDFFFQVCENVIHLNLIEVFLWFIIKFLFEENR